MDPRLKNTNKNYETKKTQEKVCAALKWAKISPLEHTKKAMEWEKNIQRTPGPSSPSSLLLSP